MVSRGSIAAYHARVCGFETHILLPLQREQQRLLSAAHADTETTRVDFFTLLQRTMSSQKS